MRIESVISIMLGWFCGIIAVETLSIGSIAEVFFLLALCFVLGGLLLDDTPQTRKCPRCGTMVSSDGFEVHLDFCKIPTKNGKKGKVAQNISG
jgi:hypothetical protein